MVGVRLSKSVVGSIVVMFVVFLCTGCRSPLSPLLFFITLFMVICVLLFMVICVLLFMVICVLLFMVICVLL